MSSLIGRFMRDLPFLRQGLVPKEESGQAIEALEYTGEEHEKLSDDDVRDLCQALLQNDTFKGEVVLNANGLSDLAALQLASVLEKRSEHNITKLNLDGNNLTSKAGEYIGQALVDNPDYPIKKISFTGICLESIGLTRMIEAANGNQHLKRLNVGILTDSGLKQIS